MANDHFHVNNHKIDKKGMIKVLILKFFSQQTLHWMLVNIVYNNTCVVEQKIMTKLFEVTLLLLAISGCNGVSKWSTSGGGLGLKQ